MSSPLDDDLAGLPAVLDAARAHAGGVLAGLAERPAAARRTPVDGRPLPEEGVGAAGALAEFAERWAAGFSGSAGPRYLGFVTGGVTPAALVGDWLAGTYDQNVVSGVDSSASDLERETVDWLRALLGLDPACAGAFVTGATMSNLVGLAQAREWLGRRRGVSVAAAGAGALGDVAVLSGTPHASIGKALSMLGLGRDRLRPVPTLPDREAVDVARLAEALEARGGEPAIVVANAGTVNTGDFDDLAAIAALRDRYPFWLHVDGAFGGFAALSGTHAGLVDGLDAADSVCVDLHKWLNVPYDAAVQFTRHRDLQLAVFKADAAYLGGLDAEPELLHLTPESSRRLRALPAWFTLRAYGAAGDREIVARTLAAAGRLGQAVAADPALRLLAPVRLNVVCFTLADRPEPDRVAAVGAALADSGECYLTGTTYRGVPALRAAFCNWRTGPADVDRVAAAIAAAARKAGA
ncbi:MAG: pyridoxal phosphate-dependent decarboxylase family protein [Mycobacteriales bacterium]